MSLITVGIHENLVLTPKTQVNEHGSLEIGIKVDVSGSALLDAFKSNSTLEAQESTFRIYPPSAKDFKGNIKTGHDIASDFLAIREQYMTIASIFGTDEEVADALGGTQMLEGLGVDDLNKAIEMLTSEDHRKKVNDKLSKLFLDFLESKGALKGETRFRMKFPRQSKDKNYPSIPRNDKQGPWIEPMSVPLASSSISWSDWEIDEGRNSGAPVASSPAVVTEVDKKTSEALFAKPAVGSAPDLGGTDSPASTP